MSKTTLEVEDLPSPHPFKHHIIKMGDLIHRDTNMFKFGYKFSYGAVFASVVVRKGKGKRVYQFANI